MSTMCPLRFNFIIVFSILSPSLLSLIILFFSELRFELRTYTLSHSTSPCNGFFQNRVSQTICLAGFEIQSY
jgi:hypothetical protein